MSLNCSRLAGDKDELFHGNCSQPIGHLHTLVLLKVLKIGLFLFYMKKIQGESL